MLGDNLTTLRTSSSNALVKCNPRCPDCHLRARYHLPVDDSSASLQVDVIGQLATKLIEILTIGNKVAINKVNMTS